MDMHEEHDLFKAPKDENQKIWRYMDITKFLDLLTSKSLYFTRSDKFDDIFEGSLPKKTIETRTRYYQGLDESTGTKTEYTPQFWNEYNKKTKEEVAINCWHMNDYESAAMWKLYLNSSEGIAVQSTYSRLTDSLNDNTRVFVGTVKYVDYQKIYMPFSNSLWPFVHKRKSFEHENELRAVIWLPDDQGTSAANLKGGGFKVRVDLMDLIENIYVSPDSPAWMCDILQNIIKKFKYRFEIIRSSLLDSPLY